MATIYSFLKKLGIFGLPALAFFALIFFVGEQFEVGRLSAIAQCESSSDKAVCIRSKGYLGDAPFYPDLGRRYVAGFSRVIGGELGAKYRASESSLGAEPVNTGLPPVPAMPTLPLPSIPAPAKEQRL